MLTNSLLLLSIIVFILLCLGFSQHRKYQQLKIKTEVFSHDIKSALVMFNLTLNSLAELVTTKQRNDELSLISLADLPSLIEVLDEAEKSMTESIRRWNA